MRLMSDLVGILHTKVPNVLPSCRCTRVWSLIVACFSAPNDMRGKAQLTIETSWQLQLPDLSMLRQSKLFWEKLSHGRSPLSSAAG